MSQSSRTAIARFVNVRAPQAIADTGIPVARRVTPPKTHKSGLLKAAESGAAKTSKDMRKLAAKVLATAPADLSDLALDDVIRAAVMPRGQNVKAASELVEVRLGKKLVDLLKDADYRMRIAATWERIYALSLTGQDRRSESNLLRAAEVMADLAYGKPSDKAPTWSAALTWKVVVPKALFLPTKPREAQPDPRSKKLLKGAKQLLEEAMLLESIERKARVADRQYYLKGKGAQIKLRETKGPIATLTDRKADREFAVLEDRVGRDPKLKKATENLWARIKDLAPASHAGMESIEPENWLHSAAKSGELFNAAEKKLLARYEAEILSNSELDAIGKMRDDVYARTKALLYQPKHALPDAVMNAPEVKALAMQLRLPDLGMTTAYGLLTASGLPRVHVLGIGDLVVVEEKTSRYELGEVAHIENVMASETRNRTHLRISETEVTTTTETQETAVDEKSLQTTTRFELSNETQTQLEASLQVTAGASVSAGYGPVSVSANMGVTSSISASTSTNTASTLAREAVEKAVSKVTRSIREEQITRVLNRIEETNEHGFVNATAQHVSGIYRWVDKYVTVRAVNYGRRLMLEMIVPEPANGLVYAEQMHADEEILVKPPTFHIGPKDVTRSNYLDWAEIYGAADIPAPPKERIYQTLTYGNANPDKDTVFSETGKTIAIPEGYQTTNIWKYSSVIHGGDYISRHVAASKRFPNPDDNSVLEGVTGSLQLASNMMCKSFMVGWKVRCELTLEAYQAWQLKAWAALKQASDAAHAAYLEALAAQAVGKGVHIEGRNPGQNKEIVRNELKRAAIRFLSNDMGELVVAGQTRISEVFNAAAGNGNFHLDEARVEGMIIQFFEQAFEWHNMTWLLYPYFWGNSARHHTKLLADDPDPAMREFYSAGAARVVVPVPVDYEDAVLNFFETNEIWSGGEPPQIDDPEYVSIAEELKQGRTNSFNTPIYYESAGTPPPFIIDEWEEKLPTSLVMLQPDSVLPVFPAGLFETDVAGLLDAAAQRTGNGTNWRNSIIDLLTLYSVPNPELESSRRAFAANQGYPGDPGTDATASVDSWSYFYVMGQINLNGLPGSLLPQSGPAPQVLPGSLRP